MTPLLSLVLPVYGVENDLGACLDSILSALESAPMDGSFEVICVDDGSPDRCGEILEAYRARFAELSPAGRIAYTVIHQANAGVSVARNTGLERATGEWIWFIDSDDAIAPFALSYLVRILREHPVDVLRFGYRRVTTQQMPFPSTEEPLQHFDLTTADGVGQANARGWILGMQSLLWNACFRRAAIGDVRFPAHLQPGEDEVFALRVVTRANALAATHTVLYNYLQRPSSCMRAKNLAKTRSILESIALRFDILRSWAFGAVVLPRPARFTWVRDEMCGMFKHIVRLPAHDRRQILPRYYEVGASVFEGFPFQRSLFRAHSALLVFLFLYLPWKIRSLYVGPTLRPTR